MLKAPIKGPENVIITELTHESAVVSWLSIPVKEQQGFLLHYLIWLSGQGKMTLHEVKANETSFRIKNLHLGALYIISIAGKTIACKGLNSAVNNQKRWLSGGEIITDELTEDKDL